MKLKPIPATGIVGDVALREAAAGDFASIMSLVSMALEKKLGTSYPQIAAIFPTRVITQTRGRSYAYEYAIDSKNEVSLGEAIEVLLDYQNVALREAAAVEFNQVMDLLRGALKRYYGLGPDAWVCMRSVYPDRAIVERDGRLYSFDYTIGDDNVVSLVDPVEVVMEPKPVGGPKPTDKSKKPLRESAPATKPVGRRLTESAGVFIEALADSSSPEQSRYLVRVIRSGVSKNGVSYPASVLREAAPLFDGVRVFEKSDVAHIKGDPNAKSFRSLIGRLVEPRFVEASKDTGEIQAVLEVLESSDVAAKLREAVSRGMTDMFGLSIDAAGTEKKKPRGRFREATSIVAVESVDLIISPGAGGQVIRFAEAHQEQDTMLRQQMLSQIRTRNPSRADALVDASDEEVLTAYREAFAEPEPASRSLSDADIDARIRMSETRAAARATIAASRLPAPLQERLQTRFAEAASFTAADVQAAIDGERQLYVQLREADGSHVRGLGGIDIQPGEDRADKAVAMLDDFFDPTKRASSFREAYIEITGDRTVSGLVHNCSTSRLRDALAATVRLREAAGATARFVEAVSAATWADVLGDSIARAMIREYNGLEAYEDWRWLCDVVPVNDFRTQERTRIGGYGNLPTVAENGPYNALSSPTDEKATYAVTKRGGIETISLETIANDDVGVIRRIPLLLATSAKRTLYEFVYDFLATNPVIYDGLALFVAGHNNLGTTALSATSFAAARLAMKKQAELSSNKRLGLTLRHLAIPSDLEELAFDLFVRGTNLDETFTQSRKPKVHVVDSWTDANNWFATADNAQAPLVELGFLGGNEDPDIFVQDTPTQGSLFSNDQIKYKIRHIYGGNVRDFRPFYGAIVA